jgi:hypothetical protein
LLQFLRDSVPPCAIISPIFFALPLTTFRRCR